MGELPSTSNTPMLLSLSHSCFTLQIGNNPFYFGSEFLFINAFSFLYDNLYRTVFQRDRRGIVSLIKYVLRSIGRLCIIFNSSNRILNFFGSLGKWLG